MSSMLRPRLLFNEVEDRFPNAIHGLHRGHGLLWMACSIGPELSPRMQSSTYSVSITILLQWSPGLLPGCNPLCVSQSATRASLQWSLGLLPGCNSASAVSISRPVPLQWSLGLLPRCNAILDTMGASRLELQWSPELLPGYTRMMTQWQQFKALQWSPKLLPGYTSCLPCGGR